MRVLHISVFLGSSQRHGGVKRSEQLRELLEGYETFSVNPYLSLRQALRMIFKYPFTFIKACFFSLYLFIFKGLSFRGFVKFALQGVNILKMLKGVSYDVVVIETAPGISIPLMYYLAHKGISYIAVPHNIEHMVPAQVVSEFRSPKYVFMGEYSGFKSADDLWVISEFDKAVLACGGVKSKVVPYYPISSDLKKFEAISRRRKYSKFKSKYLLLGTVSNRPTLYGMQSVIEDYSLDEPLIVAGFGTEVFLPNSSNKIIVKGSVTEIELEEILSNVKGVFINQPQTTGFLTKIVELNISAVPIFVVSDYQQAFNLERFGVFRCSLKELQNFNVDEFEEFSKFPIPELDLIEEST